MIVRDNLCVDRLAAGTHHLGAHRFENQIAYGNNKPAGIDHDPAPFPLGPERAGCTSGGGDIGTNLYYRLEKLVRRLRSING